MAADGDEGGLKHFERALALDLTSAEVRQTIMRHTAAIRATAESLRHVPV